MGLGNRSPISLDLKLRCVAMAKAGVVYTRIYNDLFHVEHPNMSLKVFQNNMSGWVRKYGETADPTTLFKGTYDGFTAHAATVQVGPTGEVKQAWIKQNADDRNWEALLEEVRKPIDPVIVHEVPTESEKAMLEIPLFDMHFPLNTHFETCCEVNRIIKNSKWAWEEINLIIGQDLFHNDDMRGRTSKGTPIEKVNMPMAWRMAIDFWVPTIQAALAHAERVNLIYSKGNHDETISWAFVQLLKALFPQLDVDDSLDMRKCISWRECFIGITHGHEKKNSKHDLRGQFTIEYPIEFANAKVREIHTGHFHHEVGEDLYGVMVRRLSKGGEYDDDWTKNEGFVGAHRRFMVFEWAPGRLRAIHYI